MRVPCGLRVEVLSKSQSTAAEVMNISQRGFFLRASASSPGEALRLSTSLAPQTPLVMVLEFLGESRPVRAKAEVAWKSDLGVGLNFVDPPERLRDFISDLQDASSPTSTIAQVISGRIEIG